MNCLVTGGAGFIGSNLVRLLIEHKYNVRVVDNLSTGYKENLATLDIEFIQGDVRDSQLILEVCRGIDVVFHLAASIGNVKSLTNPQEDSEINIIGTLNVLEAARKQKVRRLVYSSSAAIFGELLTMPISEDHPQNPDSPYGVSKLAGEKHVLTYGKLFDISVACLRYFNVYGINQRYDAYGNVIPIFANRLISREPLTIYGDGEQTRDFVNVKDVAMANYLAATTTKQNGVFNIGSGTQITINQLVQYVQKASNIKAKEVVFAPPRPSEVRHCRADISKAKMELGFSPDSNIEEGLCRYFDWFSKDRDVV